MIKGVVFDLDGVYFERGTKEFLDILSSKYDIERDRLVEVYTKSEKTKELKMGLINDEEYWKYFRNILNIDMSREELVKLLISCYEENEEVVKYIDDLKNRGIKVAICTNNFRDRFENLDKKFNLRDRFDVVVTSYEVGVGKPNRKIFDVLKEKMKLNSDEILMSDDKEENVNMLNELGFKGILYTDWNSFKGILNEI